MLGSYCYVYSSRFGSCTIVGVTKHSAFTLFLFPSNFFIIAVWSINILWIVVVVSMLIGAIKGFKRGLVESVMRLLTSLLGIVVLVVLAKGIGNFLQKSYVNVLMALILLMILNIFHEYHQYNELLYDVEDVDE